MGTTRRPGSTSWGGSAYRPSRFIDARHAKSVSQITQQRPYSTPLETVRENHFFSRWLFLRLLGLVYLVAFVSSWVQVDGLIGSNGILPARDLLERVSGVVGGSRYWRVPTLYWLSPSDAMLHGLCAGGCVLAALLVAGIAPVPCLAGSVDSYLSLGDRQDSSHSSGTSCCSRRASSRSFSRRWTLPRLATARRSRLVVWLLRWLLFRLMFAPGREAARGDPALEAR